MECSPHGRPSNKGTESNGELIYIQWPSELELTWIKKDLRLLGQTTQGIYAEDPLEGVHPEILERYCGVNGQEQRRPPGQTGAGHPEDEEVDDAYGNQAGNTSEDEDEDHELLFTDDVERSIAQDQQRNIRHDPIKVKRSRNPFTTEQGPVDLITILSAAWAHGIIPNGYGVLEAEWNGDHYPETETIKFGKKRRELEVILPTGMWLERAILWAQALDIMVRLVEIEKL